MVSVECLVGIFSTAFLRACKEDIFNSGGTDSQIFTAENLNVDIP